MNNKKIENNFFLITLTLAVFIGGIAYYLSSSIIENNKINSIVKHSKDDVTRLQLVREYYTKYIVKDLKKNIKNLKFSYDHKDKDATLPFPTTVIHDLTTMYSSLSDSKIELYSEYPFLNRKDRVLSAFQKEAIIKVEENPDGVFYKKDVIDGQKVLRVAVADYMILPACVNCHNSHKLKNWPNDKWKLGDKRGVVEIITPID
jgi:hypothetical protein